MVSFDSRQYGRGSQKGRAMIAHAAARLIAENGCDHAQAKRKALRQLGLPETTPLPGDAEIDHALSAWQDVFEAGEQEGRITDLRRKALELMRILQDFSPYLTGSVLDGNAGRHAGIDLQLFADSAKEVEIFLLNQKLPFSAAAPRHERAEAAFTLDCEGTEVRLAIYPAKEERTAFKRHDGSTRARIRLPALESLLSGASGGAGEKCQKHEKMK
ncbi:MAG: hypothetical protein FWD77_04205 [Betaproteobacteria bacterium]|nr:hypothetical protein [Betaproteobacteria bacterium]